MTNQAAARPKGVSVIGWVWIALGFFVALIGAIDLLISGLAPRPVFWQARAASSNAAAAFFAPATFIYEHIGVFRLAYVLFGILVIYFSLMFLRLKSWARTGLEVMNWFGLLFWVVSSVYFTVVSYEILPVGPNPSGSMIPSYLFRTLSTATVLIIMTLNAVPLAVLLWWLRKGTVRDACKR